MDKEKKGFKSEAVTKLLELLAECEAEIKKAGEVIGTPEGLAFENNMQSDGEWLDDFIDAARKVRDEAKPEEGDTN